MQSGPEVGNEMIRITSTRRIANVMTEPSRVSAVFKKDVNTRYPTMVFQRHSVLNQEPFNGGH